MRTLEWDYQTNELRLIDQRILPGRLAFHICQRAKDVSNAIYAMIVRGAPAIGAAAAFGLALTAVHSQARSRSELQDALRADARMLNASRPTAVNLRWSMDRVIKMVDAFDGSLADLRSCVLKEAQAIADEDVETNRRMAAIGAELIHDGDTILHHCNTGSLAAVDWGTALGVIRTAHEQGKRVHVLVDETRPRLQGARLTAWELKQYGISYDIICDNMAGYFLRKGDVQKVLHGADRIAANGDVANKIGTYMLDLSAHTNNVPVYPVSPFTTIDMMTASGDEIEIEERDAEEVLGIQFENERVTPEGSSARNPSFDITPHQLITAIVTEKGVLYPPFQKSIHDMINR